MKVSINSLLTILKDQNINIDSSDLLEKIELQIGAIEEIVDLKGKFDKATIVKVLSVKPHPNADKLQICLIDDNKSIKDVERDSSGLIQVVCGAPNVREGIKAVWLPPSSIVPSTLNNEELKLEPKDIRGVKSNGMLASLKELDLGDDHTGIAVVDNDSETGTDFAQFYNLKDDKLLNLENKMFTHRPDCFGYIGLARELAGINMKKFTSPDWYNRSLSFPIGKDKLDLTIVNNIPNLVPRFNAVTLSNVAVTNSPLWLKIELAKADIRPINNIVDLTNYLMIYTSQPLHAYDYDKLKNLSSSEATIQIRKSVEGEKLKLLNGKEITLGSDTIAIATDKQIIGLGGVMGGNETEVDSNTKNIILECANFDMYTIRKTSMKYGLFTDAVTRFTKGQSPLGCPQIISKCASEITKITSAIVTSDLMDVNNVDKVVQERNSIHENIITSSQFINARLGTNLETQNISDLLLNVEFEINQNEGELNIKAPFYRTDISFSEDIIEEVGRLYGYHNIPVNLPKRSIKPPAINDSFKLNDLLRQNLSSLGANEVITYSFVHEKIINNSQQDKTKAFKVANALSPKLQYYRLSLTPNLLNLVRLNLKARFEEFILFEFGKTHSVDYLDEQGLPVEEEFLSVVIAKDNKLNVKTRSYYLAKQLLEDLIKTKINLKQIDKNSVAQFARPFEPSSSALIYKENELIGVVGEFKTQVSQSFKLPRYCSGFEIKLSGIRNLLINSGNFVPIPRYPYVIQDITLKIPAYTFYEDFTNFLLGTIEQIKPNNSIYSLDCQSIYQSENDKEHKNISYNFQIASYNQTLSSDEVNNILDKLAITATEKYKATRV